MEKTCKSECLRDGSRETVGGKTAQNSGVVDHCKDLAFYCELEVGNEKLKRQKKDKFCFGE